VAKQQRDLAREQHWRSLVSEWRASGSSVREFCRQRAVTEPQFYAWRRTLAERDVQTMRRRHAKRKPAKFVPVTVLATGAVEVRCPSGHVVTLPSMDGDTLRQLFVALAKEPAC
jgi:hypothetical protein